MSKTSDAMRINVLMVTYDRAEYTRVALGRLLETCDDEASVWLWHNGDDPATLEVVRSFRDHPRMGRYHESSENVRLRKPTNWLMSESDAPLLAKVADDNVLPEGWCRRMREAHADAPEVGVLGSWPFREEDVVEELASKKIKTLGVRTRVLLNCWVGGTGCVFKRAVYEKQGPIPDGGTFPAWCNRAAAEGWVNGWLWPLVVMENFDDPRHPMCRMKTDEDVEQMIGLSGKLNGVTTIDALSARIPMLARQVQEAPYDPGRYHGWRAKARRGFGRVKRALGQG